MWLLTIRYDDQEDKIVFKDFNNCLKSFKETCLANIKIADYSIIIMKNNPYDISKAIFRKEGVVDLELMIEPTCCYADEVEE